MSVASTLRLMYRKCWSSMPSEPTHHRQHAEQPRACAALSNTSSRAAAASRDACWAFSMAAFAAAASFSHASAAAVALAHACSAAAAASELASAAAADWEASSTSCTTAGASVGRSEASPVGGWTWCHNRCTCRRQAGGRTAHTLRRRGSPGCQPGSMARPATFLTRRRVCSPAWFRGGREPELAEPGTAVQLVRCAARDVPAHGSQIADKASV